MTSPAPIIRKFTDTDAEGVAALFREVYGGSYPITFFYDPAALIRKAAGGEISSVVAAVDQKVAGHIAMRFNPSLGIPERGQSVVSPSWQGMGLFSKMLDFLHATARGAGIAGLYNEAVTTHPFSQKGSSSAGARECGLQLNLIPGDIECGMGKLSPSRKAAVILYKNLEKDPVSRVFIPDHEREIIAQIYAHMGIVLKTPITTGSALPSATLLNAAMSVFNTGLLTVHTCGDDFPGAFGKSFDDLLGKGASMVILDLPMGNEYLPRAVSEAEARGFIFSGVIPRYYKNDDCLRMQYIPGGMPVDWDDMVLVTDFARMLAGHIRQRLGERGRV